MSDINDLDDDESGSAPPPAEAIPKPILKPEAKRAPKSKKKPEPDPAGELIEEDAKNLQDGKTGRDSFLDTLKERKDAFDPDSLVVHILQAVIDRFSNGTFANSSSGKLLESFLDGLKKASGLIPEEAKSDNKNTATSDRVEKAIGRTLDDGTKRAIDNVAGFFNREIKNTPDMSENIERVRQALKSSNEAAGDRPRPIMPPKSEAVVPTGVRGSRRSTPEIDAGPTGLDAIMEHIDRIKTHDVYGKPLTDKNSEVLDDPQGRLFADSSGQYDIQVLTFVNKVTSELNLSQADTTTFKHAFMKELVGKTGFFGTRRGSNGITPDEARDALEAAADTTFDKSRIDEYDSKAGGGDSSLAKLVALGADDFKPEESAPESVVLASNPSSVPAP